MEWCEEKRFTEAAQISDYLKLSREQERQMQKIVEVYPMAVTSYYLSLVDPEDPEDPILVPNRIRSRCSICVNA